MTKKLYLQFLKTILFLATTCALLPQAYAQPWYQIEVILFEQNFPDLAATGTTEEAWPTDVELEWQQPLLPMFESEWQITPALRKLPINSRTMNGDAYAFRVTDGYRLLWHQAWTQPLVDEPDAPWLIIEGGEEFEGRFEIEGSLRIHLSRFLHMTANLWLTDFSPPQLLEEPPSSEELFANPLLFSEEPLAIEEPSENEELSANQELDQEATFYLSQLPEKPELYNACSYLRFQPETPVPQPADILQEQPVYESWWTAPYGCDLPRSALDRGKPLYAPMLPIIVPQTQQISYLSESSGELVELDIPMPEYSVIELGEPNSNRLNLESEPQSESELGQIVESAQAEETPITQITKIDMNRRLRSEEYHFVDHPKLGMLIRILEVEAPTIEPSENLSID